MTDPAIRIACAEECGWKSEPDAYYFDRRAWRKGTFRGCTDDLPDYPNDLNSCAQFEATLTLEERFEYSYILEGLMENCGACFATARMRCIAFLKVKGRWKECEGECSTP